MFPFDPPENIRKPKPALIQAVFHVGDRFWARENWRPKNWKTIFFQDMFHSLKMLMHITSLFSYT